ncbi:MAG: type IV pilus biogenesis/stability protein PilW [Thiobacillaceae bacterium]|jgi:type IV pilus assembly protein PilF
MRRVLTIAITALAAGLCACSQMSVRDNAGSSPGAEGTQPLSSTAQKARVFTDLSAAYFQRGQFKVALENVRKAISEDSRYGPAYNVLGLIYMELAEDQLAEENFRKAVELDRADSEAHNNYGWFLCTRGRYDEGLAQFTDALRNPLYSTPEKSMSNAGLCNEKKGEMAKAEASFIKALKLQPDYPLALLSLAKLKYKQAKLEESLRLLTRYHDVAPATAESLWLGVQLERKLGDKDKQAEFAAQLHKSFPDSHEDNLMTSGQYE